MSRDILIRELKTVEEFERCVELQREAFNLPDMEISPVRHLIVTNNCGGFTLGAFTPEERMVGFVHHLIAARNGEIYGYSHMAAIAADMQNAGIGAKLKWAQRRAALERGQKFIKWTFDPMQARNAHFNLNRLGAIVRSYAENYYGTDYNTTFEQFGEKLGLNSDRLFAEWQLESDRVTAFERGEKPPELGEAVLKIEIPANWKHLVDADLPTAVAEQTRVRREFQQALAAGLICAGFERGETTSGYLFYKRDE